MTSNRFSAVSMAALVVGMALFGTVAFAGTAAAASGGSISATPVDAGATSTHVVTLTAGSATAGSWTGFEIDYSRADANFTNNVDASDVEVKHVEVIGIDRGDDNVGTTVDVNTSDDVTSVSTSNNGETLTVGLGGAYELNAGDEVVVVVSNIVNPEPAGQYEVALDINPQSSGGQGTAMLNIGDASANEVETSGGSITANPVDAGAISTHVVTLTAGSDTAGSWNGFQIDYSRADANVTSVADVSNVETDHIEVLRIDRGDDQPGVRGDVNVEDDLSSVSTSNNGETLTIGLGGSYDIDAGDELIVVVDNVINPKPAGQYEVALDINPQSSGGQGTATLNIGDASAAENTTTTTTTEESTTTTTADETTTTESDGGTTTTESGGTPGFGIAVALVALLAAAALRSRREN